MATIPIRIILQGLIALVPKNGPDGATMTALVVNAINSPEVECYAKHKPELRFPTSSQDCTAAEDCEIESGTICFCKLKNQEISLLPAQTGLAPVTLERSPARIIPFDKATGGSFAYIPNLSALNYNLDQVFLSNDPSTPLPPVLAARFQFPFETAGACELVTRPDEGADYVFAANLRPLGKEEDAVRDKMTQALAQSVEATVAMNVNTGETLMLRLSPLPGIVGETYEFELPTNLAELKIRLKNEREDHVSFMLNPDKLCDDGVGRDFAFFYELAENKPASWKERPVPHLKYRISKSFFDLYPLKNEKLCTPDPKAPLSRPICPMASF